MSCKWRFSHLISQWRAQLTVFPLIQNLLSPVLAALTAGNAIIVKVRKEVRLECCRLSLDLNAHSRNNAFIFPYPTSAPRWSSGQVNTTWKAFKPALERAANLLILSSSSAAFLPWHLLSHPTRTCDISRSLGARLSLDTLPMTRPRP